MTQTPPRRRGPPKGPPPAGAAAAPDRPPLPRSGGAFRVEGDRLVRETPPPDAPAGELADAEAARGDGA